MKVRYTNGVVLALPFAESDRQYPAVAKNAMLPNVTNLQFGLP
jgi:hypothetical protein